MDDIAKTKQSFKQEKSVYYKLELFYAPKTLAKTEFPGLLYIFPMASEREVLNKERTSKENEDNEIKLQCFSFSLNHLVLLQILANFQLGQYL